MQAHAIAGPWAAGERVLVCVDERPERRRRWCATPSGWPTGCARPGRRSTSRPPRTAALAEAERDRIAETLRLAEQLGGEAVTLPGRRRRRGRSSRYARGQQRHPDRHRQVRAARAGASCCTARSPHDLIRSAGDISVHVIAGDERRDRAAPSGVDARRRAAAARAAGPISRHRLRRRRARRRRRCSTGRSTFDNVALVFLIGGAGVAP